MENVNRSYWRDHPWPLGCQNEQGCIISHKMSYSRTQHSHFSSLLLLYFTSSFWWKVEKLITWAESSPIADRLMCSDNSDKELSITVAFNRTQKRRSISNDQFYGCSMVEEGFFGIFAFPIHNFLKLLVFGRNPPVIEQRQNVVTCA
jgi:hypothetical protein